MCMFSICEGSLLAGAPVAYPSMYICFKFQICCGIINTPLRISKTVLVYFCNYCWEFTPYTLDGHGYIIF